MAEGRLSRSPLNRCSPLPTTARSYTADAFQLRELAAVSKLRVQALRGRGQSTPAADSRKLPSSPNTTAGTDPVALWRAPDDWLVYSTALTVQALNSWVAEVHSEVPLVVTDVSSASIVLALSGGRALDVLMRDCTLDLEGEVIPPDGCAQTLFAQTSVMIHRPLATGVWYLFIERSVALHVWDWLVDTAGPSA